jgi:hypothetical protein
MINETIGANSFIKTQPNNNDMNTSINYSFIKFDPKSMNNMDIEEVLNKM